MALIFFDKFKGGHGGLLGSKLTPEEMKKSIKLEEHVSIFDDYMRSGEAGDGTYGWQGQISKSRMMTAPKDVTGGGISTAQRAARVRARMQEGLAPQLVSMDPDTGIKIFAEEDKEAYESGYICPQCVQYQAVPNAPKCNWLRKPDDGCGYRNF